MIAVLAALFTSPVALPGLARFGMMLPLCLSIAVIYKTTRCEDLRKMPVAALILWITIVIGMYLVGFVLWAAFEIAV